MLIIGPQWQLERYAVLGGAAVGMVRYQFGPGRPTLACTLSEWQEWARNAEVIVKGADDAE